MRGDWGKMAEEYLSLRPQLALSVQLVDSRHKPTALDIQLHEWLVYHDKPHVIAATKADKLSNNQYQKAEKEIQKVLPDTEIVAYSSETGKGRDRLWTVIQTAIKKSANNS
jgi:GTP-binding protein